MRDRLNKLVKLAKACNALKPKARSYCWCVDCVWLQKAAGSKPSKKQAGSK